MANYEDPKTKEKDESEEKKPTKRNGRNRKGNSRRNGNRSSEYKGKRGNDISWHAKSKQLLTDAACIPWSYSTGRPINRGTVYDNRGGTQVHPGKFMLPGIFALQTVLTPGCSSSKHDPINVAAQALYTDIRSMLKSANAYEASDVMIYMLLMAEIKAIIAWLRRLLGTAMNYSYLNNYLPDALIRAQGIQPATIHGRYAEVRSAVNQAIAKAAQIWWPKGFDFVTRAEWEYGNYYSEGDSIKDQIYMFVPGLFRKFVYDETLEYAGSLKACLKIDVANPIPIDQVVGALNEMIDSAVGDSDFQNIAGDLFNRYGAGGVETFTLIPDSYVIQPTVSFEVLEQIQNARCLRAIKENFDYAIVGNSGFFDIYQDEANNILLINNSFNRDIRSDLASYLNDAYYPMLTVDKDPSDEKTMLITRCTNVVLAMEGNPDNTTNYTFTVDCAMEWVVNFCYFWFHETSGNLQVSRCCTSDENWGSNAPFIWSPFHYHPIQEKCEYDDFKVKPYPILNGSFDTYAIISPEQIRDMNRVDLMSLFAVPNVGNVK